MKFVKNEEESKKFSEIDESYMTEECPSESEDVVNRHAHEWRSDGNYNSSLSVSMHARSRTCCWLFRA